METSPVTCRTLEDFYHIDGHQFEKQYKEVLSGYKDRDQLEHAESWLLFPENIGASLAIDETFPQFRNPLKVSERCGPNRQECDFSCSDWLFTLCWLICEHDTVLSLGVTNNSPSKTFGSFVTGIEYGPVVQPSVLRVDVQRPLSGDTDPFRRDNNEGEDKALQATFHVYTGENFADLGQQVLVKILQHGGKEKENSVVLHG